MCVCVSENERVCISNFSTFTAPLLVNNWSVVLDLLFITTSLSYDKSTSGICDMLPKYTYNLFEGVAWMVGEGQDKQDRRRK